MWMLCREISIWFVACVNSKHNVNVNSFQSGDTLRCSACIKSVSMQHTEYVCFVQLAHRLAVSCMSLSVRRLLSLSWLCWRCLMEVSSSISVFFYLACQYFSNQNNGNDRFSSNASCYCDTSVELNTGDRNSIELNFRCWFRLASYLMFFFLLSWAALQLFVLQPSKVEPEVSTVIFFLICICSWDV